MTQRACPACGKPLQPQAVLCIDCGFDLRTGRKIKTAVTADPAETRAELLPRVEQDRGDHGAAVCDKFQLCQLRGLGTRILICDDREAALAYIYLPARPLWTCFTVLVAVPMFFLVPLGLGLLFASLATWADWSPGTPLLVVLFTLDLAAGVLASLVTANLMAPRRRFKIWEDESRSKLLLRVRETWKFGTARLSVLDADDQLLGRILHRRRRHEYMLVDQFEKPLAMLLTGKIQHTTEWGEEGLAGALLGLVLGLLFGWLLVILPRPERTYSEWFLYEASSFGEAPCKKIGRITFNPGREYPYRVDLSGVPQQTVVRSLLVALMGLLEW